MNKIFKGLGIIGVVVLFFSFTYDRKKYKIFIEEYDCIITPQKKNCIDTITVEAGRNNMSLKIYLSDCRGKMYLQCYDSNHVKIEEGNYINSLDLLKKYTNAVSPRNMEHRIKISEYYQPLRSGKWFFYSPSGKVLYTKIYDKGVLQDSTAIN